MCLIAFRASGVPAAFRDRRRLRRWLNAIVKKHDRTIENITFVLLSDDDLLEHNRRFLKHNYYTDVITFSYSSGPAIHGDVLLSYDRIRANARSFNTSVQDELRRVMVHGLFHLLGQKDGSVSEKRSMRALEDWGLQEYRRIRR